MIENCNESTEQIQKTTFNGFTEHIISIYKMSEGILLAAVTVESSTKASEVSSKTPSMI